MAKITYPWHRFIEQLKNPIVLVVIVFIPFGIWGLWLGQAYESLIAEYPNAVLAPNRFQYFLINLAPELAGISLGVGTIDLFNGWRQEQQLKRQLIRQLGSTHNEVADTAANELRANGRNPEGGDNWLTDGSLYKAPLSSANLKDTDLRDANLKGALLWRAIFEGADLRDVILEGADLRHANLKGTLLIDANLIDANLLGANLNRAILIAATVADSQFAQVMLDETTIMPNGERYKPSEER
jgi:hypothetical protein